MVITTVIRISLNDWTQLCWNHIWIFKMYKKQSFVKNRYFIPSKSTSWWKKFHTHGKKTTAYGLTKFTHIIQILHIIKKNQGKYLLNYKKININIYLENVLFSYFRIKVFCLVITNNFLRSYPIIQWKKNLTLI